MGLRLSGGRPDGRRTENQPTGHGPKGWLEKGLSASLLVRDIPHHFYGWQRDNRAAGVYKWCGMLFTQASHPDSFEANGMPPTYDSMH
jgi:hypothetical protein